MVGHHSDGLADPEWEQEVERRVRVAKRVLSYLTAHYPDLFSVEAGVLVSRD